MSTSNRLLSVDAFRGLTVAAMILVNYPGSWGHVYAPLLHAQWNGITPTDFIFPFFIFIVGVSIALSYSKQAGSGVPRKDMVRKIIIRSLKIYVIGLLLHYLPAFDFSQIDLFGVLQRIAIVFMVCALIFIFTSWKTQIYIFGGILLLYWIALCFIPTSQFSAGTIEPGVNFAAWFDRLLFSAKMLGKHGWNAEGVFSTFPAIATGVAGLLAGRMITVRKTTEETVIWLFAAGVFCVLAGSVWDWQFPINKKIWTSSYVGYTAGWASIILAMFMWFIDLKGFSKNFIIRFGLMFGSNAIAVYVMADVFQTIYEHTGIHDFVYLGLSNMGMAQKGASLIWALISVGSCFVVAWWLYKRKWFIKL